MCYAVHGAILCPRVVQSSRRDRKGTQNTCQELPCRCVQFWAIGAGGTGLEPAQNRLEFLVGLVLVGDYPGTRRTVITTATPPPPYGVKFMGLPRNYGCPNRAACAVWDSLLAATSSADFSLEKNPLPAVLKYFDKVDENIEGVLQGVLE